MEILELNGALGGVSDAGKSEREFVESSPVGGGPQQPPRRMNLQIEDRSIRQTVG